MTTETIAKAKQNQITQEITHMGVTAPLQVWELLGYRAAHYRDDAPVEARSVYTHLDREATTRLDGLIAGGKLATGRTDDAVIGWAVTETARRAEERARTEAMHHEANALTALAQAIRDGGEIASLERVIGRLSERTQYAVRQQLQLGRRN